MPAQNDSFTFGGVDMLGAYGIRGIVYDVVKPKLRPRKLVIPGKDGTHDYGDNRYDERTLRINCDSMRGLSRHELRELTYLLSKKSRIVLWDEPDKFYLGRIYDDAQLKYIGTVGHEFVLTFVCDPFAYGEVINAPLPDRIEYAGTARSPTRLEIRNNGQTPIQGVRLVIRRRSDTNVRY